VRIDTTAVGWRRRCLWTSAMRRRRSSVR